MSGTLEQRISTIQSKSQLLVQRYRNIEAQRDEALAKISALESQLKKSISENEYLRRELEFMKISSTIAPQEGDVERSRKFLKDIVWEIDKCIKQLSE